VSNSEFDGIVVGGGHNGLITAAYLAKAGLKVAVFEGRAEVGGGFATEEVTAPGFRHHLHAHYCKIHESPVHSDLNLDDYDVSYVFPDPKMAIIRKEGYFLYHQDREKTYESIKKVSAKDAETYRVMSEKWRRWYRDFILPEMYSAPKPPEQWREETMARPGGAEYIEHCTQYSPIEYANMLFESEVCRLAIIRGSASAEYDVNYKGIPALVFATIINWFNERTAHVVGGIRRIPFALKRIIEENGGKVLESTPVSRILIEDGEAKGVSLADGTEYFADKFVASSIDPVHTFFFLVGDEHLSPELAEKVANFRFRDKSLFRVHLALKERPHFTMASKDPTIDDAWKFTVGFEFPGDFEKVATNLASGQVPDVDGVDFGLASIFDDTQAPKGQHVAYAGIPAPFDLADGGAEKWPAIAKDLGDKLIAKLREYAPNMTDENILGRFSYTPKDIEEYLPDMVSGDICQGEMCPEQLGYNRPWPGMSQYLTPFGKLYMCGASTHPGGHAVGASGYNAANRIAEDLGLEKWWPEYDPEAIIEIWEDKPIP
jgi:phytoene dehydrogenase-like protein